MSEIPFGKRMFPEIVKLNHFVAFGHDQRPEYLDCVFIRHTFGLVPLELVLSEQEATAFAFAHPAVKALVEVAKEARAWLQRDDEHAQPVVLYEARLAKKVDAALAPFEKNGDA